ncbi:MAG: hypothetical protein INH41_23305 [Myxococcaceae bacterium]|jgi:hypothetical protein|nr:hypothetical protein [Myxococcaceae bacterium]MCA3015326.1 hypothetical protein [Myxococcaceae bacterium]
MSRAYRISIKESLSQHVQVEDGVSSTLELLPILQKERMRELLAAELTQRGFVRDGAQARRREANGVEVEVDLETGQVSATIEGHQDVKLETERAAVVDELVKEEREAALRRAAQAALAREAKAEEEALRKQATQKLEATLRELKGELDGVVNRVTATALKARAAELGQVEEVHEDANGGLTIKVRV